MNPVIVSITRSSIYEITDIMEMEEIKFMHFSELVERFLSLNEENLTPNELTLKDKLNDLYANTTQRRNLNLEYYSKEKKLNKFKIK